jgi:hypothetical protein
VTLFVDILWCSLEKMTLRIICLTRPQAITTHWLDVLPLGGYVPNMSHDCHIVCRCACLPWGLLMNIQQLIPESSINIIHPARNTCLWCELFLLIPESSINIIHPARNTCLWCELFLLWATTGGLIARSDRWWILKRWYWKMVLKHSFVIFYYRLQKRNI